MSTHCTEVLRHAQSGGEFVFDPVFIDRDCARVGGVRGEIVKLVTMHGCPPQGTMDHVWIGTGDAFYGIVHVNSLSIVD